MLTIVFNQSFGGPGGYVLSADPLSYSITLDAATLTYFNGAYVLSADPLSYSISLGQVTFGGTGVSQPLRQLMGVGF